MPASVLKIDIPSSHLKWVQNVHIALRVFIMAATRSSDLGPGQVLLGCFHPILWVFGTTIQCQEESLECGKEGNVAW
jgi:hypothetical protein